LDSTLRALLKMDIGRSDAFLLTHIAISISDPNHPSYSQESHAAEAILVAPAITSRGSSGGGFQDANFLVFLIYHQELYGGRSQVKEEVSGTEVHLVLHLYSVVPGR
jgi:hypothetical protein